MKKLGFLLLVLSTAFVSAQRFTVLAGDLKNLKGISEYIVTFDYVGLEVEGFETEEAYLAEKMEKREKYERSEAFRKNWYEDRAYKYEPKFMDSFNKRFEKGEIKAGVNRAAKFTMHIKTTHIYPGYAVVAGASPAKVSAIVTVFETMKPSNVLVSLEFKNTIGLEQGTFAFDQGFRIAGAYEKLAKNIVMQLKRFL